jgi:hypothetical protein
MPKDQVWISVGIEDEKDLITNLEQSIADSEVLIFLDRYPALSAGLCA